MDGTEILKIFEKCIPPNPPLTFCNPMLLKSVGIDEIPSNYPTLVYILRHYFVEEC